MSEYTYFVIRHKKSGELMPQGQKSRGYSHWNPSNKDAEFKYALPVPRLLDTRRTAAHCIIAWAANPNATRSFMSGDFGTEEIGVDKTPDGRKKEDLEVVEVTLTIKE